MSESYLSASELEALSDSSKFESLPPGAVRNKRKQRDTSKIKGLPSDDHLLDLATAYLTEQCRLWPESRNKGLIPAPDDAVAVAAMVVAFKQRHISGVVELPSKALIAFFKQFASAYSRFSHANSKTTSIIDQLTNELRKAQEHGYFVPWEYVFADYAVTGLDRHRSGYTTAKALMAMEAAKCARMYIDDFTRASRDELEWWRLASALKRLGKTLIGASDGFDLLSPNGELQMWVYGLLSRLFLKGNGEKSRRGREGAIRRGTVTGRTPFGFLRVPVKDQHGNVILKSNGKPIMTEAVDENLQFWVVKLFEWYAIDGLSKEKIARLFNEHKVDGSYWWTAGTIGKLIRQAKYIGVFIYNRTSEEYDLETGKRIVHAVPREKWIVRRRRELAIIDWKLWKKANERYRREHNASPLTGRKISRNERNATTLLSGLLFCTCGRELTLNHSNSKYASFKCFPGEARVGKCKLRSNKSARIIEAAIPAYLSKLLGEESIDELVRLANSDLARLQSEGLPDDTRPLRAKLAELQKKIKRSVEKSLGTDDANLTREYERQGAELGKQAEAIREKLAAADRQVQIVKARPITREGVVNSLADVRAMLARADDRNDIPTLTPAGPA